MRTFLLTLLMASFSTVAWTQIISNTTTTDCLGTLYDTGGAAGQYGAFEAFQYAICPTDPHDCISINVVSYDTEAIFDNLNIYDGPDNTGTLIANLNGNGANEFYTIPTTGCVTIGFNSDGGVFGDGFELTWECTSGGCPTAPPDFITCAGTFYDTGGPNGNYGVNEMESWTICPDSSFNCLGLTFVDYDVENFFDPINVFAGPDATGQLLGTLQGVGSNVTFNYAGCLTVTFTSDGSVTNPGWEATWLCTQDMCPPDGTSIMPPDLTTCIDNFYDSGGLAGTYLNNESWIFNVCPSAQDSCIIIDVNDMDLSADGDMLTIYDGMDNTGPVLGQYFGAAAPEQFQVGSGCFAIEFFSNAFGTGNGWDISWECTTAACTIDSPIDVDPNVTPTDMTDNISSPGVVIDNVTVNCPTGSYGTFTTPGNCNVGMTDGIIITNGTAVDAEGPNTAGGTGTAIGTPGDPDLDLLLANTGNPLATQDVCILEFDIYAPTNMLSFNYSFGSEEYPEFAPPSSTNYNDAFGFFISGPGIAGPYSLGAENIALIPGTTTPVTINNVNAITNQQYYIDNTGGLCVEYDAFTTVLTASAQVIPCETYHIKLAVADVGDGIFDSGVFIEANSLSTGTANISPSYEYSPAIDVAIEGCATGFVSVNLDGPQADTVVIYLDLAGTATNGVDYTMLPDSLIFYPGDSTITISIDPIDDGIIEGPEEAIIYLISQASCGTFQADSAVIDIEDAGMLSILPQSPFTTCLGSSVQIEATGALSYEWSTGDTTAIINVSPATTSTYSVTGTIGNCTLVDDIQIIIDEPEVIVDGNQISCFESIGEATANINGGTPPYTYEWEDAAAPGTVISTTNPATGLSLGTYNVTVTDVNGCLGLGSGTVTELLPFAVSVAEDVNSTCNGNNGQATVTVDTAPASTVTTTYLWDNGQSTATAIGLTPGNHDVTVTIIDAAGNICVEVGSITINTTPSLTVSAVATPEGCGGILGTLAVSEMGGTAPFQYSLDGGINFQIPNTFTGLTAGAYNILVQDSEGCLATTSVTVGSPPVVNVTASAVGTTCGNDDGSITITAVGGTAPFQYSIDGCTTFQAAATFTGLPAGTYDVCIIDDIGCDANTTINVAPSDSPMINTAGSINTSCGEDNGVIYISVTGGVQNYEYSIDGGTTFQNAGAFPNLPPGTYDVVVVDAIGCTDDAQVTVAASTPPQIDFADLDNPSSCGSFDGEIEIFASGGTPPLMYSNNNGMVYGPSSVFTGLGANTYNLVVMDAAGCYDTLIVDLVDPADVLIDSVFTINPMCGEEDGFIEILISGGNPNFEYSIDNGVTFQGSNTFANLPDGVYEIIVEDFFGCRATTQVSLFQAGDAIITNLDINNATCGDDNGNLTISAANGTTPYEYSIDGLTYQTSGTFTNLPPGQYTVWIRDAAGCETEDIAIITTDGAVIIADIDNVFPSGCDIADGSIQITANGGTPPYEFSINNGMSYQNSGLFSGLSPNTFNVVVVDANGCTAVDTTQIASYDDPVITDVDVTDAACGVEDGIIAITITGGNPNYEYSIDGGLTYQGSGSFDSLPGGIYDIVITDFLGCQETSQAIVNSTNAITITDIVAKDPTCGNIDGSIAIVASNNLATFEYSIDGGLTFQTNSVFTGLGAGIYDIIVQDSNGCQAFAQVVLTDNGAVNIDNIQLDDALCDDGNGTITVTASGGNLPYQFSIDNGQNYQGSNIFTGLVPGTYNVAVEDAIGCITTQVIQVISAGTPEIDNIATTQSTCNQADGSIEITVTGGGTPAYQYSIDGGTTYQASNLFEDIPSGIYDIIVEDVNGCQSAEQVEIFPTMSANPVVIPNGPTDFCFYEDVSLYAGEFESYIWSTGDTTSTITVNYSSTFLVTVTDAAGCTGVALLELNVTPPYSVNAGDDQIVEIGDDYEVGVQFSNPNHTYSWTGTDGSTYSGDSFTETATSVGSITYTVTAVLDGCEITDEVTIITEDNSIYEIGNAFSPNDDGLNDTFGPLVSGTTRVTTFKVFNRWGELVHDDATSRWDGNLRDKIQVTDVYTYVIILQTFEGEQIELVGDVTLLR